MTLAMTDLYLAGIFGGRTAECKVSGPILRLDFALMLSVSASTPSVRLSLALPHPALLHRLLTE